MWHVPTYTWTHPAGTTTPQRPPVAMLGRHKEKRAWGNQHTEGKGRLGLAYPEPSLPLVGCVVELHLPERYAVDHSVSQLFSDLLRGALPWGEETAQLPSWHGGFSPGNG